MKEDILRYEECTAPSLPPGSTAVAWCAWLNTLNPPMAMGRDAEQAHKHLRDHLLHFFREESEPRHRDPEARADEELVRQKNAGLVWVIAPDEQRGFQMWQQMSALVEDEAVRLWRMAFPLPPGAPEPLIEREHHTRASATRAPYVAGVKVRGAKGYSRRRVLIGQLVERLPHLDTGRLETLCRHAEAMVGGG